MTTNREDLSAAPATDSVGDNTAEPAAGPSPSGRVAVIGTGAIGSAVVRRLIARHRQVLVWNRNAGRTTALTDAGAQLAETVSEAVRGSSLTLLTVKDYQAVHQCLDQIQGPLTSQTIAVLCTGTPADARQTAARVRSLGADYLDAGVQTGPEMIGTPSATLLFSGSRTAFELHRQTLELLGRPRFVGTAPEAAAVWDLTLFGLWYDAQLGVLRALEAAGRADLDIKEFAATAHIQLGYVVGSIDETARQLLVRSFPPGPAELVEHLKVMQALVDLRADSRLGDGGIARVGQVVESLIAEGRGHDGLTATIS